MRHVGLFPTVLGWKAGGFFVALVGAFFAAPYSNLYFLLLAFLGSLGVLGALWSLRNLRGVDAEIPVLPAVPAGAPHPFAVDWTSEGGVHLDLLLEIDLARAGKGTARAELLERATRTTGSLPALARGVYAVRRTSVVSSYPLGLLRARRAVAGPDEIVVYPTPADLPEARNGGELVAHLSGMLAGVDGADQPSGLREFRPGDELRAVHWRATARRGALVVREWEGDAARGLEVVVDRRCAPEALEEALSLVAALALAARDDKESLTLHTQGTSSTFGGDHAPWAELFRLLATAQTLSPNGSAPPPASPSVLRLPLAKAVRT